MLNRSQVWTVVSIASALLAWEAVAKVGKLPEYVLPSVEAVTVRAIADSSVLATQGTWTLLEIVSGFLISAAIAIPLAMLVVLSRTLERLLYPPIVALNSLPKVAVAPLLVVWFGFGLVPKIGMTILIAFFPILVNTMVGLRGVDPDMLQLGRSMNAGTLRLFLKVRLPHALPSIFAGLKVASGLAVIGALIAEFIGSDRGWGYLLVQASGQLDTPLIFAILVLLSVLAVLIYYAVVAIEKLAIPWHASQRNGD